MPSFVLLNQNTTFISASKLGHSPISSLRLNTFLYFMSIFISLVFSFLLKAEFDKSIFSYKISSSVQYLLGPSSSSQGYGSDLLPDSLCFSLSCIFLLSHYIFSSDSHILVRGRPVLCLNLTFHLLVMIHLKCFTGFCHIYHLLVTNFKISN